MPSRVERNPQLRGTKRRVAIEREVLVARGRADGRTVIIVPEVKGTQVHRHHAAARALPRPPAGGRRPRACCRATDRRYDRLVDWVTETEATFRDDLLADDRRSSTC